MTPSSSRDDRSEADNLGAHEVGSVLPDSGVPWREKGRGDENVSISEVFFHEIGGDSGGRLDQAASRARGKMKPVVVCSESAGCPACGCRGAGSSAHGADAAERSWGGDGTGISTVTLDYEKD